MLDTATLLLLAAAVLPQSKWREIGKTSTGNSVFLEGKSVRKAPDGINEAKGLEYRRRTIAKPGFGPVFSSTFADVALTHLCAK